jgi:hypothetical protein
MMEANVFLGTFNAAEMFWYLSPDLCLDTILYGQFIWPHILVFALTYTVNCGTLYRQVWAVPNHVQSIEFTTCGLQSSCRNIKDDQWKQNAPELYYESHSKGSEYLCKKGSCLFLIHLQKSL